MIVNSTPSSITYQDNNGKLIKFLGEWTLEPKFYLDKPASELCYEPPNEIEKLSVIEINDALDHLLNEAKEKGWVIVFE